MVVDKEKEEHYKRYGWECSETNLSTLPAAAPQAAKDLAKWLTLEGRRKSLTEWLECVDPSDSRIHGKFWGIGAWTGRMSHSVPNQANIVSPFHDTPKTAVEEIKHKYDGRMRGLWRCTPGNLLVGTDADAAQLRVLTHYMESPVWRDAIERGDKKKGTDIHTMNMKALGSVCKDRDTAKTFIYAWLLGAGLGKVATILNCSTAQAKTAYDSFLDSFPELKRLKEFKIPNDASRGYFIGLDGRRVPCDSEHLMLAGYLQNGEAVVLKSWVREWRTLAKSDGLWFKQVDFVHDEVQVEVKDEESAKRLIELQTIAIDNVSKDLELYCPFRIEAKTGRSWSETH